MIEVKWKCDNSERGTSKHASRIGVFALLSKLLDDKTIVKIVIRRKP